MKIYEFDVLDMKKNKVSMSRYEGKVMLIVNTATRCGFTPQYDGLEKLHEQYNAQGLEILGFPCNQFAHQAPENEQEIASFCSLKYNVNFTQFAKIDVNGDNAHPLYAWLKEQKTGTFGSAIKWNFTKFLVDRQGNVVGRFGPMTTPEKLESEIKKYL
ncbi:MAG: glutathione peroxidase [Bacteroidales bacterium]|nr:glutathione peroxidase [Bacteroidales bacterium]